jgi:hypothetical protein
MADGSLVGMNFYDGRNGRTPFLPYKQICEVLHLFGLELQRYVLVAATLNRKVLVYSRAYIGKTSIGRQKEKRMMSCADWTD